MIEYNDFIKDPSDVWKFSLYGTYRRDGKALKVLNATLGTSYKALFRKSDAAEWQQDNIDWSGEHFFVVTKNGVVIEFTNSEWGGVGIAKKW